MTRTAPFALCALLLVAPASGPVLAQDAEGPSLFDQGADLLLRGLQEQVQPQIDQLTGIATEYLPTFAMLAREMGPAFVDVFGRIDAIANYEPPVILPNGDIVLRRREDAPAWVPEGEGPEVQL